VQLNADDGCSGGVTLDDAVFFSRAIAAAGTVDVIVVSCGLVQRNGFFMLRGNVPLRRMASALASTSLVKAAAVLLFGRWAVPRVHWGHCFLRDSALRVLREVTAANDAAAAATSDASQTGAPQRRRVGVMLVGGVASLADVELALADGFCGVQMARALIREPDFVNRVRTELQQLRLLPREPDVHTAASAYESLVVPRDGTSGGGGTAAGTSRRRSDGGDGGARVRGTDGGAAVVRDCVSLCTRCNECVLAALSPTVSSRCPLRSSDLY
jgi:2,4-dienoyl-CoA reductase-like NADH-dependent reductase (Old Yellow Enzyme family)